MKVKLTVLILGIMCVGLLVVGCGPNESSDSSDESPTLSSSVSVESESVLDAPYTEQTFEFGNMTYSETTLAISFDEDTASGYVWQCEIDGTALELSFEEFLSETAKHSFTFTGVEEGTCSLHFEEVNVDDDFVRDTFSFDVEVDATGKIKDVKSW